MNDQYHMMDRDKIKGFSLIELLITLSILSILLAVSLPNFQDTVESINTNSQAKLLMTTLSLARSEAIKRGTNVAICPTDNGLDCREGVWSSGWMVFVDTNGDATGGAGSVDVGDIVIRVYERLGSGSALTFTGELIQYNNLGFSVSNSVQTLKLCPSTNNALNAHAVVIGLSGRGRRVEAGLTCP